MSHVAAEELAGCGAGIRDCPARDRDPPVRVRVRPGLVADRDLRGGGAGRRRSHGRRRARRRSDNYRIARVPEMGAQRLARLRLRVRHCPAGNGDPAELVRRRAGLVADGQLGGSRGGTRRSTFSLCGHYRAGQEHRNDGSDRDEQTFHFNLLVFSEWCSRSVPRLGPFQRMQSPVFQFLYRVLANSLHGRPTDRHPP